VLLPTTVLCDKINSATLDRIGTTVHNLDAIDILETIVKKSLMPKIEKAYQKVETDTTRTAGLEKSLRLCVGVVMLKQNKDVDTGLVNGLVEIVQDFLSSKQNSTVQIHSVKIKFQNLNFAVQIQRESCSFQVHNEIFYTKKQFSLMLAFGITVHKFQSLSLNSVIIDAGPATFGCGMVYVALFRVTTLHGLHLVDLDETKIKCDTKVVNKYNRLRDLYTPHVGHLGTAKADIHRKRVTRKKLQEPLQAQTKSKSIVASTNIFYYCNIRSLDYDFKKHTSQTLNLVTTRDMPEESCRSSLAQIFAKLICNATQQHVNVAVCKVAGDGNCLFRPISLKLTNSENSHRQLRDTITRHMFQAPVLQAMSNMFADINSYIDHVEQMTQDGTWGTENKIIAAAHLFSCSIVCLATYNEYHLQHFPPHFLLNPQCNSLCHHQTLYLINSTESHYDLAIICTQ